MTDASGGSAYIAAAFGGHGRRAALMPYLMGGFPDVAASRDIGEACADAGADLVELGVPYSDPLADGPVVHAAGSAALRAGARLDDVLDVGAGLSERLPVVLMCYANLVYARGLERFVDGLAARGIAGLIVPDLPLEEAPAALEACDAAGVALVPLVAPNTPDDRLAAIGERARGFVYTVAVTGTTGERRAFGDGLAGVLERARRHAAVPLALGFGISTPEHAREAAEAGADGVIVGSRLVREAAEAVDRGEDPAPAVGAAVEALGAGLVY